MVIFYVQISTNADQLIDIECFHAKNGKIRLYASTGSNKQCLPKGFYFLVITANYSGVRFFQHPKFDFFIQTTVNPFCMLGSSFNFHRLPFCQNKSSALFQLDRKSVV